MPFCEGEALGAASLTRILHRAGGCFLKSPILGGVVCLYCADDPHVWYEAVAVWVKHESVPVRNRHNLPPDDYLHPVPLVCAPFLEGPKRAGTCDEHGNAEYLPHGASSEFRSYPTAERLAGHFTSCEQHYRTVIEDVPGIRDAFSRDSRVLGALAYTLARTALPRLPGIHDGP